MIGSQQSVQRSEITLQASSFSKTVDLAIVTPTYNERDNVARLVNRLRKVLKGVCWEIIFVDDDSPDGTATEVRKLAATDPSIRLIHRIGRRGLASACVEGMLSTSARFIAVMDADLQHDESILLTMLESMRSFEVDLTVASRNMHGGSKAVFTRRRLILSDIGAKLSSAVCKTHLTDPMSGFFMITSDCLLEVVRRLSNTGFKILVDIVASADRELRIVEVPYTFRLREYGESKLDINVGLEYLYVLIEKITHGLIPVRFAMFLLVGGTGLIVHLFAVSFLYLILHTAFLVGQAIATLCAMTWNFFLNNAITFRHAKLRGFHLMKGLVVFYLICSFGALSNLMVARDVFVHSWPWMVAALAGVTISSVWNYSVSSLFTWHRKD